MAGPSPEYILAISVVRFSLRTAGRSSGLNSGIVPGMAALAEADEVYLGAVNRADKLKPEERFDVEAVAAHARARGRLAYHAPTNAELLELLTANSTHSAQRPRLVVFFSNGSFDGIIAEFVRRVGAGTAG